MKMISFLRHTGAKVSAFILFAAVLSAAEAPVLRMGPAQIARNEIAVARTLTESMMSQAGPEKQFALDLYWDLRVLQRRRSITPDTLKEVEAKIWAVTGPSVLKIELKQDGAVVKARPERTVVSMRRPSQLFLIVKNDTGSHLPVAVAASDGRVINAGGSTFHVWADTTMGFPIRLSGVKPGKHEVILEYRLGEREVRLPVQVEIVETGRLKVTILEADTGHPVTARVSVTGSDRLPYAPDDSFRRQTMTGDDYFYAVGGFQVEVPAGHARIEVTRGFEYELYNKELNISAGAESQVTVRLERLVNMAKQGWYSGDIHIHANYLNAAEQFVTPELVFLQIMGEDLNLANMQVANSIGAYIHDEKYFEGKPHPLSRGNHVICWNEEFRNFKIYGHLCLIGLEKLVRPIYTGFPGTPNWADFPPNYDIARETQRQNGAVSYPHPFGAAPDITTASARELPVDLALGVIDAVDVLSNADDDATMEVWYKLLNTGLRCAVSAGSDAFTNVRRHWIPGADRTYVHLGPEFSYEDWIRGYKRGVSFATNGPILFLTVNGHLPGDTLSFKSGDMPLLDVEVRAVSWVPIERVEIIVNGEVFDSKPARGDRRRVELRTKLPLQESSWIAARCIGGMHRLCTMADHLLAHTSPVYCLVGDRPVFSKKDCEFFIEWIKNFDCFVDKNAKFARPEDKEYVRSIFRRAIAVYEKKLKDNSGGDR